MLTTASSQSERRAGCFSCCSDGCEHALSCWKPLLYSQPWIALGPIVSPPKKTLRMGYSPQKKRFVVGFCGSGTGHMTQTLAVMQLLKGKGYELAGILCDVDASQKMIDETLKPLGVPILVLPAVKLVDPKKGTVPTIVTLASLVTGLHKLKKMYREIDQFFCDARAEIILSFWHVTLAYYLRDCPPPDGARVINVAPQFALQNLNVRDLGFWEIIGKATIDVMANLFKQTGNCLPLSALPKPNTLPPILELPNPVSSYYPRLILCYFLAQTDAIRLERLLAQYSVSGVEFHCFTADPLTPPKGRPLALASHKKQRALFRHYFEQCSGIICSTGNETIWEGVSRGVPVLTVPTAGHPEQMMNARIHGSSFPNTVRAVKRIHIEDVRWLIDFEPTEASRAESEALRVRASSFAGAGFEALLGDDVDEANRVAE